VHGVAQHADVTVGVGEPGDGLSGVAHGTQHHLGVEVVGERGQELALNGQGVVHEVQVVVELVVRSDDDAFARGVKLGAPRAPENLHHI